MSYFELFELPSSMSIDNTQLSDRYRALQRAVHPDRYANASDRERRLAVQKAAEINDGYQTLKDPLKRARHLLELQGVEFNDEMATTSDPEFLMLQMELRESLGSIKQQTDPHSALANLYQQLQQHRDQYLEMFSQQFEKQDFATATATVQQMQFFRKLQQEAEMLEEELLG